MSIEKLLPQSLEAEAGTLGSILIDPECLPAVMGKVRPEDMYRAANREIYQAMHDLMKAHEPVDLITLTDELARRGKLDEIGGISYVSSLANGVPTSANAEYYAAIVRDKAGLRRLIHVAGQIAALAYNEPDFSAASSAAQGLLLEALKAHGSSGGFRYLTEVLEDTMMDLVRRIERTAEGLPPAGIKTGFTDLDAHIMSLENGELALLCARPGGAKSTIAGTIALNTAAGYKARGEDRTVAWISMEMPSTQNARRLLASLAGVNGRIMRAGFRNPENGELDRESYRLVRGAAEELDALAGMHLRMRERAVTLDELRTELMREVYEHNCGLAVIDQVDLIRRDERSRENDYERLSRYSYEMKQMALDFDIPVLLLVQLNRATEDNAGGMPDITNLRGTGRFEQDADWIWAAMRPAKRDKLRAANDETFRELLRLAILKGRDGEADTEIALRFQGEYTRVSDWPRENLLWYHHYLRELASAS
jgi:replicative DNA helicase